MDVLIFDCAICTELIVRYFTLFFYQPMCRAYNPTHNTSRLFIFYLLAQFIEKELEYYHHKLSVQDTPRVEEILDGKLHFLCSECIRGIPRISQGFIFIQMQSKKLFQNVSSNFHCLKPSLSVFNTLPSNYDGAFSRKQLMG